MENPPKAESILEAALKMNAQCEIAIYNLAVIAQRYLWFRFYLIYFGTLPYIHSFIIRYVQA